MPIVQWNMNLLTGIQEIDLHHKHLVELLNETYDEFREKESIAPTLIDELTDYASYHFACEERLMEESSYPKLGDHRKEHEAFRSRIGELRKAHRSKAAISVELLWFLCNWINHHIRETDAEFGRYADLDRIRRRIRQATR